MEKFTRLHARTVPLPINDVDTDLIIPAQFLTSTSRDGYGENLFKLARANDPQFPLNQEKYQGAEVLVAGSNFGCGSSREHAVWAICGAGFRVVIAKSFADIFYNNSAKNSLLLVALESGVVDEMLAEAESGQYQVDVDLERQMVILPNGDSHPFDYDPFRKHCLLNGLDDIDYILASKEEITAFRAAEDGNRFFSTI